MNDVRKTILQTNIVTRRFSDKGIAIYNLDDIQIMPWERATDFLEPTYFPE